MKISLGIDKNVIGDLVKAFTNTTKHVIQDIRNEHDLRTGNFRNGGSWDVRFKRIREVALLNDLVVLEINRGALWTFNCVLNLESQSLIVFSKDKNLETVIKKLGKNSIHYFHALVSVNGTPYPLDNEQLSFLSKLTEEYEEKRLEEVRRILGEEYPNVKQVVFVVAKEQDKQVTSVEARLFNKYFELLDFENWTSYVTEEYNDIFVSNEQDINDAEELKPIAKVKDTVKKRKNYFDIKVTDEKEKEEKEKEEDTK